ncbi:MAG: MarC family protein [Alphaproteobacteria bacterium]|nr:MarC family protein [Alphaproteobacteria bacterium]
MLNSVLEFIKTFNITQFTGAFIVLFAIIDIIGTLPIVMNLQRNGRIVSASRASIISLILFVGFMYMGEAFLGLFSLDISSFAVAGSIIIFIIAMEMVLDLEIFRSNSSTGNDATFTPVVFPLIAGAGSFTTLLSIRSQYSDFNILLAVLANVLIVYFALKSSKKLEKILSPGIICIFQKAFGIILLSISVKLFTSNLTMIVENISKCAE